MDFFTLLFRLPLMPLQGFIRLAEVIRDEVEQEARNPASVRRQLEDIEEAEVSGEVSDRDVGRVEAQAVGRVIQARPAQPTENRERS